MDRDERRKKREAERRQREQEIRARVVVLAACGILMLILIVCNISARIKKGKEAMQEVSPVEEELLSEGVLEYRDLVEYYAQEEGIEDHVGVLLAIMEVETKGSGGDVMQSSESKGLRAGTLGPEESIEQACYYYAELLRIADENGCDEKSVIQAYNFGPSYILFVSKNGGVHTQELATEYARQKSGGVTVTYNHDVAEDGWIYKYGNMYYEARVEEYLP